MLIRNVIFDFGGVLVRWKPQEIIDGFYSEEILRDLLKRAVFGHPDWIELDAGSLDEDGAVCRFAARMDRSPDEMRALLQAVKDSLQPLEESFAFARELDQRGFRLYGLSNMSAANFSYLRERYEHWRVFRGIVVSGVVKLIKPDRAIFEHICQRYQLEPTETVFVDDHAPNIEAARQLGFRTILFGNVEQCARDFEILIGKNHASPPLPITPPR